MVCFVGRLIDVWVVAVLLNEQQIIWISEFKSWRRYLFRKIFFLNLWLLAGSEFPEQVSSLPSPPSRPDQPHSKDNNNSWYLERIGYWAFSQVEMVYVRLCRGSNRQDVRVLVGEALHMPSWETGLIHLNIMPPNHFSKNQGGRNSKIRGVGIYASSSPWRACTLHCVSEMLKNTQFSPVGQKHTYI